MFSYYMWRLIQAPRLLGCEFPLIIFIHHLFSFLIELLSTHARMFHTLQVNLRLVSKSGGVGFPSRIIVKV